MISHDFLANYGLFLAKILTATIAILATCGGIFAIASKNKFKNKEKLELTKLNHKYHEMRDLVNTETLDKNMLKKLKQQEKKTLSLQKQQDKNTSHAKSRTFVLEFNGDLRASAVDNLREEITAILTAATPQDEVLVKIESSGGTIHGYGLAASQLKRIREKGIPLITTVDKVAASGGYMMACVADRILAAPFAVIGSIGVIAQLPNFHRLLKKHDIDFEQVMAGQYKRTLSLFGENTKEGRHKLQQEVNEAHDLFKEFIALNRPIVAIDTLATGETWYGTRAKELHLIDEIITSDDYLLKMSEKNNIFKVKYTTKKNLIERLTTSLHSGLTSFVRNL